MKVATLAAVAVSLLASPQGTPFKTGVDGVRVDVLVVDGRQPVAGLTVGDFELTDSGVAQSVDAITVTDVPISVMVALDLSTSVSGDTLDQLKRGVTTALRSLEPRDRAALLTFSSDLRLVSEWTGDVGAVTRGIPDLSAAGGTSLVDAVFAALTFNDPVAGGRRLALVFSDGADTSSWLPHTAVIDKARRTETVIYAVTMNNTAASRRPGMLYFRSGIELSSNDRPSWTDTPFLEEVVDATGGGAYKISGASELKDVFSRILMEFRTRYVLVYTPKGVDRIGWHPIEVKLKNRKGRVTARRGYLR
jgi:VWFA-related protein